MSDKIPPQDLDAEQSVLGAMMMSKDAIASVLEKLKPSYFYRDAHTTIFKAMCSLFKKNEPIDLVTIAKELKKQNALAAAGGKAYLADIVNSVPTAANVEHYADIVQEKALLRQLIDAGSDIVEEAFEDARDVTEILNDAQKNIMEITKETVDNDLVQLGTVVSQVWDEISESYDNPDQILGVSTGFGDLDTMTSGFQKAELIILAARPSMGKTSLALNFALKSAIESNEPVAIFSCEMPKEQLALRMLSAESRVSLSRLRTANIAENEYKSLSQALGRLSEAPIYIDDTPSITPMAMRAKCRRLQSSSPLSLVIVDYLQLMRLGKKRIESRFQEVSEVVRDVKAMCKELNVPIMALSQLSRDVEKRGGDLPKLSDLRESGEIEQTADLVMFIHREDYYDQTQGNVSPTKLVIAKQRNGPTGSVDLMFRRDVSRFEQTTKQPAAAAPVPL